MQKVIQISQEQTSMNEEEELMSLQEVFRVSLSPWQVRERERTITVTSGLTCLGPYTKSSPIGSLVRTLLVSSQWYNSARRLKWEVRPLYSERVTLYLKDDSNISLRPSAVILNVKDIPSARYLYRLAVSELPTAVTVSGLLPTVTAQDFKPRGPNSQQQRLPDIINSTLLPTPVASDADVGTVIGKNDKIIVTPKAKVRKINGKGQHWSVGLGRIAELLPTLRGNVVKGCKLDDPLPANQNKRNLEEDIAQWVREKMIPTPTARDWKGASSLESLKKRGKIPQKNSLPDFFAQTGKTFHLNPLFVTEMMGFPPN